MSTLAERIAAARTRQERFINPDAYDTIIEAVGKVIKFRGEAGMAASNAQSYAELSLQAADNAADALALTIAAESASNGFAEQARLAKEEVFEAADGAADAYLGAENAKIMSQTYAHEAKEAADSVLIPSCETITSGAEVTLKHMKIYEVVQNGDLDLSKLSFSQDSTYETCYICLIADGTPSISWPENWIWGTDTFDMNDDTAVLFTDLATLEANIINFIAVQNTKNGVIATVSYNQKQKILSL